MKTAKQAACQHLNFMTDVDINRLKDDKTGKVNRFMADIRIRCVDCDIKFQFIGLPAGVNLNGACCSIDACEARMTIAPKGDVVSELEGCNGFSIHKDDAV
jgi:hypothetical protein